MRTPAPITTNTQPKSARAPKPVLKTMSAEDCKRVAAKMREQIPYERLLAFAQEIAQPAVRR